MDINTAGNFNMYGTYSIDKGEYLFTLQNLINKNLLLTEEAESPGQETPTMRL